MRKSKLVLLSALAALGLTTTMAARAGEFHWSVGVSAPGVTTVVSNAPVYVPVQAPVYVPVVQTVQVPVGVPVVVHPAPGYHHRAPTYGHPAPVVAYPTPVAVSRPVIVAPPRVHVEVPPAVYAPAPRPVRYVGYPVWDARQPVVVQPVRWKHDRRAHDHRRGDRDDWRWRDRGRDDHDDRRDHRGRGDR